MHIKSKEDASKGQSLSNIVSCVSQRLQNIFNITEQN